jgi:hypothetical protein
MTLTFSQAARRLRGTRQDRPVNPSTIYRWYAYGVKGVHLETALRGGVRVTSEEALQRFFGKLNNQPIKAKAFDRAKHDEAVERELTAQGI